MSSGKLELYNVRHFNFIEYAVAEKSNWIWGFEFPIMSVLFDPHENMRPPKERRVKKSVPSSNPRKLKYDDLQVFGYSCTLYDDCEKALHYDSQKHLIPWMGDKTLLIDRYISIYFQCHCLSLWIFVQVESFLTRTTLADRTQTQRWYFYVKRGILQGICLALMQLNYIICSWWISSMDILFFRIIFKFSLKDQNLAFITKQ